MATGATGFVPMTVIHHLLQRGFPGAFTLVAMVEKRTGVYLQAPRTPSTVARCTRLGVSGQVWSQEDDTIATIKVRHDGGDRFTLAIRGHEPTVDRPWQATAADEGPTPTELFVAGLAAFVGCYAERFCAGTGSTARASVAAAVDDGRGPARAWCDVDLVVDADGLPAASATG